MHVFYLNIPWIIDERDYNCSIRSAEEWKGRGSVNEFQGAYFSISGTLFLIIYIIAMISLVRAKLMHIPCYKLMFFNGLIDMLCIIVGSLVVAYIDFTGTVFCNSIAFSQTFGHVGWSVWIGSTFSCITLAFNRVAEMLPIMKPVRFLFRKKFLYMWMILCIAVMTLRPFVTRPTLYSSSAAAFMAAPLISDDIQWLFAQSLVICVSTATAAILYVILVFVPVHKYIVIAANVIWQLSHGIHGMVYIAINRNIRSEAISLFLRQNTGNNVKVQLSFTKSSHCDQAPSS
ncbi:hypothetical protein Q1695_006854 [Nippostrongylus brasiliensis]|nr:hypothetical protein Q1695_006854 [Nippostrongylus brasiliensis]